LRQQNESSSVQERHRPRRRLRPRHRSHKIKFENAKLSLKTEAAFFQAGIVSTANLAKRKFEAMETLGQTTINSL
jgi:hypothetical protein